MQEITVLKFGGTSMGDEHTWRRVMEIIKKYDHPLVVVSATARTTRQLVKAAELAISNPKEASVIANQIGSRHKTLISNLLQHADSAKNADVEDNCFTWIDVQIAELKRCLQITREGGEASALLTDAISSIGEQLSSYLFAQCGPLFGLNTAWIDAREVMITDSQFGSANPLPKKIADNTEKLFKTISSGNIPVMGGFYGQDTNGKITTLGFEGSDYTASLIGAALNANAIEIWTDVSGIFTCDPRVVDNAKPIDELSFTEATELAYFGAKVLHPSTMKPALKKQIPVKVKNIFEPDHPGTIIHSSAKENGLAKALTFIDDATIITIQATDYEKGHQFLANIFEVLNTFHLPVDVVTTTEATVSLALESSRFDDEFIKQLQTYGQVQQVPKQAIISLIGCNFSKPDAIADKVFASISETDISIMSFNKPKKNLNLVVSQSNLTEAVKAIHKKLFD